MANILRQYNKRLDDHQMSLLLDKKGSANPLWLSLACEELRVCGDFNKIDEKVTGLSDELLRLASCAIFCSHHVTPFGNLAMNIDSNIF